MRNIKSIKFFSKRYIITLLLCLILNLSSVYGQSGVNSHIRSDTGQIENIIKAKQKKLNIASVSVAIIHKNNIIFNKAFGAADMENNINATTESVYPIASITKVFAAVMMMQLIEEGEINPDDYLSKYIPSYHPKSEFEPHPGTTLRQLASHTSGLPRDAGVNFKMNFSMANWIMSRGRVPIEWYVSKDELISAIPEIELEYRPSAGKHYSNLGFQLLGIALDKAGEGYIDFITQNIFEPMNLKSMTFDPKTIPANYRTTGYVFLSPESGMLKAPDWELGSAIYSGGIYSTASDLAKFLTVWFDINKKKSGNLLSEENLELMSPGASQGDAYLGWGKGWIDGHSILSHSGGHIGFIANATVIPDLNIGAVVLCNTYNPLLFNDPAYEINESIIKELFKEIDKKPEAASDGDSQKIDLTVYEGLYKVSGGNDKIKIIARDDKLDFTVIQKKKTRLIFYPLNKKRFYLETDPAKSPILEFNFNKAGEIKNLNFGMFRFNRAAFLKIRGNPARG